VDERRRLDFLKPQLRVFMQEPPVSDESRQDLVDFRVQARQVDRSLLP
jgi:hypothetical protein